MMRSLVKRPATTSHGFETPRVNAFTPPPFLVKQQSSNPYGGEKTVTKVFPDSISCLKFGSHPSDNLSLLQHKLLIGEPNDKYEIIQRKFALDTGGEGCSPVSNYCYEEKLPYVGDQLLQRFQEKSADQNVQGISVQRQKKYEEELQTQPLIMRRKAEHNAEASTALESAINNARGGGQPLDSSLQQSMEQAMGTDFSMVRVHTDAQSDQLNQSIHAKAFTTGQDVFFRQGTYQPKSYDGQQLIAHELAHVVQQNGEGGGTGNEQAKIQRVPWTLAEKKDIAKAAMLCKQWKKKIKEMDLSGIGSLGAVNKIKGMKGMTALWKKLEEAIENQQPYAPIIGSLRNVIQLKAGMFRNKANRHRNDFNRHRALMQAVYILGFIDNELNSLVTDLTDPANVNSFLEIAAVQPDNIALMYGLTDDLESEVTGRI